MIATPEEVAEEQASAVITFSGFGQCANGYVEFAGFFCVKPCNIALRPGFVQCGFFCATQEFCTKITESFFSSLIELATTMTVLVIQGGIPNPLQFYKLFS